VGLSHLLQASCQTTALGHNSGAIYLPLKELCGYPPEQVFEALELAPIVCIDDLQLVAHLEEWQVPLFNLFNRCRDSGCRLIISAHSSPDHLGLKLQDLLSRLKSGVSLHLPAYKDEDQRRLLQYRANSRGLYLSDEVANFLLNRLPRSSHSMMQALEVLDKASLREQRRLTLPFVKEFLDL
jgi:DnaA family protein